MIVPEKVSPAMIAPPSPRHNGSEIVIGISPMIAAKEVRAIGSSLLTAPSTTLSINFMPIFSLADILSTTNIEFFTTMPKSANSPISAGKESGVPVRPKMIKTPDMESGITSITMIAFLNDPN